MFYKQSVNNVEMVILSLDGGILDINRLRYNYFNRICKQYNRDVSKEGFVTMLGNSKTMYDKSPIQEMVNNYKLSELIEKDLYSYAKLKQNIKKDGVDELLQFFKQKKIKVAVISTHNTKRAIQYLQLTKIYQYVDFVIGGDSQHLSLPNPAILHTICTQMDIPKENAIVIASFPSLVEAANALFMNVIYLQDLIPATTNINASVYKTVKSNLEIINIFLFSKYDTAEIYSSVLGMSKEMDLGTLEKTYQCLLLEYQDDSQLVALVKRTYRHFLMEIDATTIHNRKELSLDSIAMFETEEIEQAKIVDDSKKIDEEFGESKEESIPEKTNQDVFIDTTTVENTFIDSKDTKEIPSVNIENTSIDSKGIKEMPPVNVDNMPVSFKQDAVVINDLMDQINNTQIEKISQEDTAVVPSIAIVSEENNASKKSQVSYSIMDIILDFLYVLIIASVISVIGIIGYMILGDYLQDKSVVTDIINSISNFYVAFVNNVYACIFDGLHEIINALPNYRTLLKGNQFISSLAVEVIMFTIFNISIYYLVKLAYYLIYKGREKK